MADEQILFDTIINYQTKCTGDVLSETGAIDTALSKIQARTGDMIPGAERLIHDLYCDGRGEAESK